MLVPVARLVSADEPNMANSSGSLAAFRVRGGASILSDEPESELENQLDSNNVLSRDTRLVPILIEDRDEPDTPAASGAENDVDEEEDDVVEERDPAIEDFGNDPYLSDSDRSARSVTKLPDSERRALVRLAVGLMYQHWKYRTQGIWLQRVINEHAFKTGRTHKENTLRAFFNKQMSKREVERRHEGSGRSVNSGSYFLQLDQMIQHRERVALPLPKAPLVDKAAKSAMKEDLKLALRRKRNPTDDGRLDDSDAEEEGEAPTKRQHISSKKKRETAGLASILERMMEGNQKSTETIANALLQRAINRAPVKEPVELPDVTVDERILALEQRLAFILSPDYREQHQSYPDSVMQNIEDNQQRMMEMIQEMHRERARALSPEKEQEASE